MRYIISRDRALGDTCFAAIWVNNLMLAGHDACLKADPELGSLFTAPMWDGEPGYLWPLHYVNNDASAPIMRHVQHKFYMDTGLMVPIVDPYPPVKIPATGKKSVDVAIWDRTGDWTPYRDWPYWDSLEERLSARGISYINMRCEGLRGEDVLAQAMAAKVYVGLETGVSHYVAGAAHRGLVLQSGYSTFDYWCPYPQFKRVEAAVECSPCFARWHCPHHHKCMTGLSVGSVLDTLMPMLDDPPRRER